ncbi:MAG: hypothetical protein K2I46_03475, partial [Clostridia bacterium]|nr:hypothetical protein [Clostridia bacterium]
TKNGVDVDPSEVHGVGTWIVTAQFMTSSADYYAEPMQATLKISRPTALEKPTFIGGVTYDGTEKNIEDYLNDFDPDYMKIIRDVTGKAVGRYSAIIQLTDGTWADGTTDDVLITWTIDKATLIPKWDNWEFVASDTSNGFAPVISDMASGLASGDSVDYAKDFTYKIYDEEGNALSESEVSEVGSYKIVASINASSDLYKNYQFDGASNEWYFVVVPQAGMEVLTIEWSDTEFLYDKEKHIPTYVVKDRNGNVLDNASVKQILTFDNYEEKTEIATYTIKVTVKDSDRYFIRSGAICKFKIVEELGDEPPAEGEEPVTPPSGETPGGSGTLDELLKQFKEFLHWQLIVSPICILLIVIFAGKGASYLSKSKQNRKMAESRYKTYYAWTALGLASASWTVIACVLIGLAVLSFVFMLIAKSKFNKSLIYAENLREEYERNKEEIAERKREEEKENMRMMLMGM